MGVRGFLAAKSTGQIQREADLKRREAHLCLTGIIQAKSALPDSRQRIAFETQREELAQVTGVA